MGCNSSQQRKSGGATTVLERYTNPKFYNQSRKQRKITHLLFSWRMLEKA